MKRVYKPDPLNIIRWIINDCLENDFWLEKMLSFPSSGLAEIHKQFSEIEGISNEEHRDSLIDDLCDDLEEVLGLSFLICQKRITQVQSKVLWAQNRIIGEKMNPIFPELMGVSSGEFCRGLRKLSPVIHTQHLGATPQVAPSKVEAIWAVANFYKHSDEWHTTDWSAIIGPSKQTADVIMACGVKSSSTGQFRDAYEALAGNSDYIAKPFGEAVNEWVEIIKSKWNSYCSTQC